VQSKVQTVIVSKGVALESKEPVLPSPDQ